MSSPHSSPGPNPGESGGSEPEALVLPAIAQNAMDEATATTAHDAAVPHPVPPQAPASGQPPAPSAQTSTVPAPLGGPTATHSTPLAATTTAPAALLSSSALEALLAQNAQQTNLLTQLVISMQRDLSETKSKAEAEQRRKDDEERVLHRIRREAELLQAQREAEERRAHDVPVPSRPYTARFDIEEDEDPLLRTLRDKGKAQIKGRPSIIGTYGVTGHTGATPSGESYGIELDTPATERANRRSEIIAGPSTSTSGVKPPSMNELVTMALNRFPSKPGSGNETNHELRKFSRENGLTSQKIRAVTKLISSSHLDHDRVSHVLEQLCESKLGDLLSNAVNLGMPGSWDQACKFLISATTDTIKANEFVRRLRGNKHNPPKVDGFRTKGVQLYLEKLETEAEDHHVEITPLDMKEIWLNSLSDNLELTKTLTLEWATHEQAYLNRQRTSQDLLRAALVTETALLVAAQHHKPQQQDQAKKNVNLTLRRNDPAQTGYGNRAQARPEPNRANGKQKEFRRAHQRPPPELLGNDEYVRQSTSGRTFYAVGPGKPGTQQAGGFKGCRHHGYQQGEWIGHSESEHQSNPSDPRSRREVNVTLSGNSKQVYYGEICGVSYGWDLELPDPSRIDPNGWRRAKFLWDSGCNHSLMTREYARKTGMAIYHKRYPETYVTSNKSTFTVWAHTVIAIRVNDVTHFIEVDINDGEMPHDFILSDGDGRRLGFKVTVPEGITPVNNDSIDDPKESYAAIKQGSFVRGASAGPLPMSTEVADEIKAAEAEEETLLSDTYNEPFGPQAEPVRSVCDDAGNHMFWVGTYYSDENSLFFSQAVEQLVQNQKINQSLRPVNDNIPSIGVKLKEGARPPQAEGTTTPNHLREIATKQLKDMEESGMIVTEGRTRYINTRDPQSASIRCFFKVKPQKNPQDPPKLRLLFDCRDINRVIDTGDRMNTALPNLEEFQRKMSAFNVMTVADATGGFGQLRLRHRSRDDPDNHGDKPVPDDWYLRNGEVAITFTVDRKRYRMATLPQGLCISPDAYYSTTIYRDPSVLDYDRLQYEDTYMDDKSVGETLTRIPVSPTKLAKCRELARDGANYDILIEQDLTPVPGEEPVHLYDLRPYMSRLKRHYEVQNGKWGFKDNPEKTWHFMRKVVLGGLLVGCGKVGIDATKRIQISKLAPPTTCQNLRQCVHYLLWLCKLAPNVAAHLAPCYKYCNNENKGNLAKVAGADYDGIIESLKRVCHELATSEPTNSISPTSTLAIISDSSFDYMSATLTQVDMDVNNIDSWTPEEWDLFIKEANDRVIAHYSKTTPPGTVNKGIGFAELLACVHAMDHFQHWTQGRFCLLINDNKTAIASLTSQDVSPQVWRLIRSFNKHYNIKPVWVSGKIDLCGVDSGTRLAHEGDHVNPDLAASLRDPGPVAEPDSVKAAYVTTRSTADRVGEERSSSSSASPPSARSSSSSAPPRSAFSSSSGPSSGPGTSSSNTRSTPGKPNSDPKLGNHQSEQQSIKGHTGSSLPKARKAITYSPSVKNERKLRDINDLSVKSSRADDMDVEDYVGWHLLNHDAPDPADNELWARPPAKVLEWDPEFHPDLGYVIAPRSSKRLREEYRRGTLFAPPPRLVQEILGITHALSGHYGEAQMQYHLWRLGFWISNFGDAARAYKARCEICQRHDVALRKYNQVERDTWFTTRAMKVLSMDTGQFPEDKYGYNTVSTITCVFTGFTQVMALKGKSSKGYVEHLKDHMRVFGPPEKICADGAYYGGEFQSFVEALQIKLSIIAPYYPQGNGIAEDSQKHVKTILAKYTSQNPTEWSEDIWRIEFVINNNLRSRLGTTPYYAVMHQHPNIPGQDSEELEPLDPDQDVAALRYRMDRITPTELDALLIRLEKYADKREHRFEKRRTQVLQPGQWVRMIEHDPNVLKTATRTSEPFEIAGILPGKKVVLFNNSAPRGLLVDGNGIVIVAHTSWLKVAPGPTKYEHIEQRRYPNARVTDDPMAVFGPTAASVSAPDTSISKSSAAHTASTGYADYNIEAVLASKKVNGKTFYKVGWEPTWVPSDHLDPNAIDAFHRSNNQKERSSDNRAKRH